jgi:hypothetical protein
VVRASAVAISACTCVVIVGLAAWLFDMSVERAALLAPVIVATVGITVALAILWTKVAAESLRRQRHPGRIVAGSVAVLAVLVVLSFFVELPAGH